MVLPTSVDTRWVEIYKRLFHRLGFRCMVVYMWGSMAAEPSIEHFAITAAFLLPLSGVDTIDQGLVRRGFTRSPGPTPAKWLGQFELDGQVIEIEILHSTSAPAAVASKTGELQPVTWFATAEERIDGKRLASREHARQELIKSACLDLFSIGGYQSGMRIS